MGFFNLYSNYDQFTNVTGGDKLSDAFLGSNRVQDKQNNALQLQLMKDQNAFNEQMSNTAYQRGIADMTAAGINPMLNGGSNSQASAPISASASMSAPDSFVASARKTAEKITRYIEQKSEKTLNMLMSIL